ncbi:MAG: cystathionine beta-synthase [Candidatus Eisenbacteria bacterium]|nr:cystathionine beta-synthase [Candidatus Eisenbacteria bacterium]
MSRSAKPLPTYTTILEAVGGTPMVRLSRVTRGLKPLVLAKVESFNPAGSVKDRIGLTMIEEAERSGRLKPGGLVVEATSGNTGAGLALAAAVKGYKAIFTMPDKMSQEKVNLLKGYGAKVVVTPTAVPPDSPESYYEVAKRIVGENPGSLLANQYFNPVNPQTHYESTGPEIWEQTEGRVSAFVAGMGTGGTITGVGRFLKEKNPRIRVCGVDPVGSILKDHFEGRSELTGRPYLVEGIGEDIIPGALDFSVVDEVIAVSDAESFHWARRLPREEGLLCGGSSGSALAAALKVAGRLGEEDVVVVLLPDTGERYLSKFHSDEWLRDKQLLSPEAGTLGDLVAGKASETPPLLSVSASDDVRAALELIRRHNISQLPVFGDDGEPVGTVLEGRLLKELLEGSAHLGDPVTAIMDPCLPMVDAQETVQEAVRRMAGGRTALLVREGERVTGIVTRFDLIEYAAT